MTELCCYFASEVEKSDKYYVIVEADLEVGRYAILVLPCVPQNHTTSYFLENTIPMQVTLHT